MVADGKRIVSLGFNGFPSGVHDDERLEDRDTKLAHTVHAEVNAILYAKRDLKGCTLYVTHPPCPNCAGVIIQSGVSKVVAKKPPEGFYSRWGPALEQSQRMLSEADIPLVLSQ